MIRRTLLVFAGFALSIGLISGVAGVRADEPAAGEEKTAEQQRRADALDIVPSDAVAAIAIRNVSQLIERGDKFIEKTRLRVPMRLSDAYPLVTFTVGIREGLDRDGAAALMLLKFERLETLVLAVPVADFKRMASNFKLEREDLVEGKIVDRGEQKKKDKTFVYVRYLSVRGRHLLMCMEKKPLELVAKSKSLRDVLPEEDRQDFAAADILLYGNAKTMGVLKPDEMVDYFERQWPDAAPDEKQTLRELALAMQDLDYSLGGLRFDGGLGASAAFRFKGDESRKILTRLRGGGGAKTSLEGLPPGRAIAAYAASGHGEQSAAMARTVLHLSLLDLIDMDQFISAGHRPNVVGVFGEIWQRLEGSRTALYENQNPERDGAFSLVAVLDTENAEQFVADMKGLARFVNASSLSPDDESDIDAATIAKLVEQLGDDQYRVRQTATTKLGLIGPPALSALERASNSRDVEVQFRARELLKQIKTLSAEQRADLLKRDLLSRIKPKFAWFPKQETRAGRPVDIVQLRLQFDEAPYAAQLRRLLGPQWSKLRLTTVGNRVVLLLGSNTALLDKAIANVKAGEPGLDAVVRGGAFRSRAGSNRTVEFHLSLARAWQFIDPQAEADAASKVGHEDRSSLTSLGLSIAPQRVRFDLFAPYEEVRSVAPRLPW